MRSRVTSKLTESMDLILWGGCGFDPRHDLCRKFETDRSIRFASQNVQECEKASRRVWKRHDVRPARIWHERCGVRLAAGRTEELIPGCGSKPPMTQERVAPSMSRNSQLPRKTRARFFVRSPQNDLMVARMLGGLVLCGEDEERSRHE